MKASKTASFFVVLSAIGAVLGAYDRYAPISTTITWGSCDPTIAPADYECGEFDAPLDYGNTTVGKTTIAVIKYPAQATPRLGTLFVNPGRFSIQFWHHYHRCERLCPL